MKLNEQQKSQIIDLKLKGYTSRWIAGKVGVGKSSVNNVFNDFVTSLKNQESKQSDAAKILFLDIETSADVIATFGRKNINISQSNIVQEGNQIISCAMMWKDSDEVAVVNAEFSNFTIDEESEIQMLERIVEFFKKADAVVAHNAQFDIGTIQTRMLHYGMGKLPTVKVVDTLQIARKYLRLRSNKLDSITKYFGLSNKMDNEGISLWIKVQMGCQKALEDMIEYNVQDVIALRDVYDKFVPLNASLNLGLLTDHDGHVCSNCGSHDVHKTGRLVHTGVSSFEEFECSDCGTKLRGRVNVLSKEKRKNLLTAL